MTAATSPMGQAESDVLQLLEAAGCTLTGADGRLRWALDAEDICVLLELGGELAGGQVHPVTSNRLGRLLGAVWET
jgi:hypothetical protein